MSPMDVDEALYRLRLYNEKIEKLQRSRFYQRVMADGSIKATTTAGINQPLTITVEGPDEDNVDAFLMTYRFFIQPRDHIDRPHMKEVYEALRDEFGFANRKHALAIDAAIKAIDSADAYFAGPSPVEIDGRAVSRGELHDVMIYGGAAHANRDKKEVHDVWAGTPVFPLMSFHFTAVLLAALRSIMSFKVLNERAIAFLEKTKAEDT